jgi:hypothetical protein
MTIKPEDMSLEFATALLDQLADEPSVDVRYTVSPRTPHTEAQARLAEIFQIALVRAAATGVKL